MENERPRLTVGAMIFNQKGEILLIKSPKWHGKYIFPCGHVEFGETLENATKREIKEETNLEVSDVKFLTYLEFINSKEFHKQNLHFVGIQFTCVAVDDSKLKLNEEATEYLWKTPQDAIKENLDPINLEAVSFFLKKHSQNSN